MATGSEYNGRRDPGKALPILPRPLTKPSQRIRAENLTGDANGFAPPDDHNWWTGGDYYEGLALVAEVEAHEEFQRDLDDKFG